MQKGHFLRNRELPAARRIVKDDAAAGKQFIGENGEVHVRWMFCGNCSESLKPRLSVQRLSKELRRRQTGGLANRGLTCALVIAIRVAGQFLCRRSQFKLFRNGGKVSDSLECDLDKPQLLGYSELEFASYEPFAAPWANVEAEWRETRIDFLWWL
jgi:hypothetical protein